MEVRVTLQVGSPVLAYLLAKDLPAHHLRFERHQPLVVVFRPNPCAALELRHLLSRSPVFLKMKNIRHDDVIKHENDVGMTWMTDISDTTNLFTS